jgi:hypothetical protein
MKMTKVFLVCFLALATVSAQADGYTTKKKKKAVAPPPAEPVMAAPVAPQRMAGCGLGSLAIEDNSKWSQVGASLLNATGFQSIAISFGTSNCTEAGLTQASREKEAFIEANYADLQHDVANGSGEYLTSLASLYGCSAGADSFANLAKQSGAFNEKDPDVATARLNSNVKGNTALAASCHS